MSINWKKSLTAALVAGLLTAVSSSAMAEEVGTGLRANNHTAVKPAEEVGTGLRAANNTTIKPAEEVGTGLVSTANSLWDWVMFEIGI